MIVNAATIFVFISLFCHATSMIVSRVTPLRLTADQLYEAELRSHQCGRSIAFLKNMETSRRRMGDPEGFSDKFLRETADRLGDRYGLAIDPLSSTCAFQNKKIGVAIRQIDSDDEPAEVGYFRYVISGNSGGVD